MHLPEQCPGEIQSSWTSSPVIKFMLFPGLIQDFYLLENLENLEKKEGMIVTAIFHEIFRSPQPRTSTYVNIDVFASMWNPVISRQFPSFPVRRELTDTTDTTEEDGK